MKLRPVLLVAAIALPILAVALTLALRTERGNRAAPEAPTPTATWVGARTCVACHEEQAQAWKPSHHARAMLRATNETVRGDFADQTRTHRGVPARFFQRDGKSVVHTIGRDGKPADHEVLYTFGVEPLQQYLVGAPDGRLHPLPWAWDTRPKGQGGQRWFHLTPDQDLRPGDPLHWTGYAQLANHTCVECHVTGYQVGYDPKQDRFKSRWQELGVSCEGCHGPGSAHVAWAESKDRVPGSKGLLAQVRRSKGAWSFAEGADTAHWTGERRDPGAMDTCYTCHGLRSGFSADTTPAGRFLDRHMPRLLDATAYHADGQIDAEVFVYGSFTQSKMHRAGVACSDCHEPHALTLRAQGNALCAQCHQPAVFDTPKHHHHPAQGKGGAQCVDCHMPAKTFMVVDPRRDHRLGIPRPDHSVRFGTPNACTGCHSDKDNAWAAQTAQGWWPKLAERKHFTAAIHAGRTGAPAAPEQLTSLVLSADQPAIARATALSLLVGNATPQQAAQALQAGLKDDDPVVRAAALRALEALPLAVRWQVGARLLKDPRRAVRHEAARTLAGPTPPNLPADLAEAFQSAIGELMAAERANGSRPENNVNLANLHLRLGRLDAAEESLQTALKLDPRSVPARVNLADLRRVQQRDAEGLALLQKAIELEPNSAEAQHALGLTLIRLNQKPRALVPLRRAAELRPAATRFAYVYGVALTSAGRLPEARSVLTGALRRRPADPDLLWALVEVARAQKDTASLARLARALQRLFPRDPRVQALLRQSPR